MTEKLKIQKPIAIVGLGLSGRAALRLLIGVGFSPEDIATFDAKDTSAEYGDGPELIQNFNPKTLVVSPGVPLQQEWIQNFLKGGGQLASELSIATQLLESEKIIAVTGSVGKSTCVELLGAAAKTQDVNVFVGGNFGVPLANYLFEVLSGRPRAKWLILELSSYQLENYENLLAEVSILTSLTPNHLERYSSLEHYYQTKWLLSKRTRQALVLNKRGGDLEKFVLAQGYSDKPQGNLVWVDREDLNLQADELHKAHILGLHNQDNLALVATVCHLLNWSSEAISAIKINSGLPHRLENIVHPSGVLFVNDSKATTIDSVLTAVASVRANCTGRLYLLLGGRDKNLPWESLASLGSDKDLQFLFFGECGDLARTKSGLAGSWKKTLKATLETELSDLRVGDLVLLSPGGTSLDEFRNFEERGAFFRAWALQLRIKS